jgi:tetratricopeptide (TPR) repeat protein
MRILLLAFFLGFLIAQQAPPDARAERPSVSTAEAALAPVVRDHVEQAIRTRDFLKAEQILVHEIDRNPRSPNLLTLAAGVFFLDGKYLNAATALKKAEAVAPLDDQSRFTLAMSYIAMDRRDWARPELEKLAQKNADNPLYLYWLARLDYDAQQYPAAMKAGTRDRHRSTLHEGLRQSRIVLRGGWQTGRRRGNLSACSGFESPRQAGVTVAAAQSGYLARQARAV